MPLVPVPRLPMVPDPLRRIRVPRDLEAVTSVGHEDDPADGDLGRDQVERIWKTVQLFYRSGVHPAIQLTLRRHGAVVLNRAIGNARLGDHPELVTTDTPFVLYSASKAITAMVVHLLDQRGRIHIHDRVAEYIPEYAKHGKDAITIAHVLAHRAGVPNLPREALDLERVEDREFILDLLCEAELNGRPGRALAYHAVSGGFILGEVVRRVTGSDIRTVLKEEILDPLGFRWMSYGVQEVDVPRVGRSYATGAPTLPPLSTLLTRALGVPVDEVVRRSNDPRFLTGVIPAANVISNADELSRFFELLRSGGTLDGVQIFEPRTIRRAISEQSYRELDLTLGAPVRHGLGLILGAQLVSLYGPDTEHAFGHLGFTNIIGWADPERAVAGGLVTSGKPVVYPELPNFWAVMARIGREVPKTPDDPLEL
jgi:CubicO group peptidase (beta-lactamase class C family)